VVGHLNLRARLLGLGGGFVAGIIAAFLEGHVFSAILFTEWICLTIGYAVGVAVASPSERSPR
jgi:hypothetical protein